MNIQLMKPTIVLLISALSLSASTFAQADSDNRFGVGARIQLNSGWKGSNDNNGTSNDFDSNASQLALSFHYQRKRFYTGISLQGGSFDFSNGAPEMNTKTSVNTPTTTDITIDRNETDLLAGYYFWSHISLFLDIKNITNTWKDQNYKTTANGLGVGITGFIPLPKNWTLYGSFGVVPMDIHTDGDKIGHGTGTSLEFGGTYTINRHNNLSIGLKAQGQSYDFDNGHKQTHSLGGLTIGYNFNF